LTEQSAAIAGAQAAKDRELTALKSRMTKLENKVKGVQEAPEGGEVEAKAD